MRRIVFALICLLAPVHSAIAQTVPSVRDIMELSRAGLADEVILALIEVNRPVYPIDNDTLKSLKQAGVSPQVIVAMVKSGRGLPPPEPAPVPIEETVLPPIAQTPAPQVVVIERETQSVHPVAGYAGGYGVTYAPGVYYATGGSRRHIDDRRPSKPQEPVYWGWGGKLRPDAWKPRVEDIQKDAKVPRTPQRR